MIKERINQLRELNKSNDIDGYIVPKNDAYFSEYAFPNRLKTISNFSGSAGFAIILKNQNYLFVDGRYTLQAKMECGKYFKILEIPKIFPFNILKKFKKKLSIGFDPKIFTNITLNRYFNNSCNLVAINNNLIDEIHFERKINNKFRAAEAAWILSGDNKVDTISKYCEKYAQYSDDGIFMNGAYGPPVVDQLPYIIKALLKDRFTRQAVISIWRPKPGESKDIPCTISLQFLIRNGELHCIANMRSNDIWLGTPYDIYTFSMIARYIIVSEKKFRVRGLQPGFLYLNSGSTHIYEQDLKKAKKLIREIPLVVHQESCADYNSLWKGITNEFSSGRELVDFLWSQANN